ncbi:hypothetical protein CNMCM5793_000809 [Aspergillus hiratsukae]|uniref:Large ribosomal subunit protein eL24-related N-terminal domain-containing protein n=1 Tax=Aspergillus hiratsukae TaxID=1194566 RepID=A0A8H6UGB6_9EURO|nr:hypothetical protein CNMCM5793_000809 [Aspergillus hiratsukae]KAF7162823.1 hypothetical protein CNMCM6106_009596 [Aspergillus hiratsukae]
MSPDPHAGIPKALKHRAGGMSAERLRYLQQQAEYFPLTDSFIVPKSRVARAFDTCVGSLKNSGKQLKLRRSGSFEAESSIPSRDVTHTASDLPDKEDLDKASPKKTSFRRKFSRTMTGGSVEKAGSMDRKSWQTQSSSAGSGGKARSVRSASVPATDKNLVEGDTAAPIEEDLEKLKISGSLKRGGRPASINTAQPKVVKCLRSPGDYVFLDVETPGEKSNDKSNEKSNENSNADSDSSPGLSPNDEGAEDESGEGATEQDPQSIIEKRRDAIRHIVETIFKGQSDEDTKAGKAPQDANKWDTKNIKCFKCFGDCPICGKACCIFDIARRTAAEADVNSEHAEAAYRILKLIQSVGCSVLQATHSLCTTPGGCGRLTNSSPQRPIRLYHPTPTDKTSSRPAAHLRTFKMRTYDDSFSGQKIYPGKGKLYVRGDSKIFRFQNGKSESLFLQRKNPRRIAWTVLYRRQHKKGISEEVAKKRTRRVVKHQRAIVGASLDVIKERRSMRPEARAAARQQAIKEAKEKKAASESKKKAEKAKTAATAAKGTAQRIQSKQGAKGAAPKVAAKSR